MYTDHQQQNYMSQPIDQISQSSYIKINKRFLQSLKNNQQIDDLSRYRQDSDQEDQIKQLNSSKKQKLSERITFTPNSFYNKNYFRNLQIQNDNNFKKNLSNQQQSSDEEIQNFYKTKKNRQNIKQQLQNTYDRQIKQNYSSYSNFLNHYKRKSNSQKNNTLQYYLLHKQVQKKSMNNSKITHKQQHLLQDQSFKSPKNKQLQLQRTDSKVQFQRINYKKMLQNQIKKNNDLQKRIYQLENKVSKIHTMYEQSIKQNKKMEKQLTQADRIRYQNKIKIKNLDQKIESLKKTYKSSYISKDAKQNIQQIRKENRFLKEQNQKYRIFMSSLSQSIFILKGKRPKKLDQIWYEWKLIFQGYSQKKWLKSPNHSLANSSSNKKFC